MSGLVPVIQADREGGAIFVELECDEKGVGDWYRKGECDNSNIVQAFARHRLAHTPAAVDDGTVERVARAISIADGSNPDECVFGSVGFSIELGASFTCYRRAWEDRAHLARAALAAIPQAREVTREEVCAVLGENFPLAPVSHALFAADAILALFASPATAGGASDRGEGA